MKNFLLKNKLIITFFFIMGFIVITPNIIKGGYIVNGNYLDNHTNLFNLLEKLTILINSIINNQHVELLLIFIGISLLGLSFYFTTNLKEPALRVFLSLIVMFNPVTYLLISIGEWEIVFGLSLFPLSRYLINKVFKEKEEKMMYIHLIILFGSILISLKLTFLVSIFALIFSISKYLESKDKNQQVVIHLLTTTFLMVVLSIIMNITQSDLILVNSQSQISSLITLEGITNISQFSLYQNSLFGIVPWLILIIGIVSYYIYKNLKTLKKQIEPSLVFLLISSFSLLILSFFVKDININNYLPLIIQMFGFIFIGELVLTKIKLRKDLKPQILVFVLFVLLAYPFFISQPLIVKQSLPEVVGKFENLTQGKALAITKQGLDYRDYSGSFGNDPIYFSNDHELIQGSLAGDCVISFQTKIDGQIFESCIKEYDAASIVSTTLKSAEINYIVIEKTNNSPKYTTLFSPEFFNLEFEDEYYFLFSAI